MRRKWMAADAAGLVAMALVGGVAAPSLAASVPGDVAFHGIDGLRETTDRLLIRLAPGIEHTDLTRRGLVVLRDLASVDLVAVRVPFQADPERIAKGLLVDGVAAEVFMDYVVKPIDAGDDPLVGSQWHLDRIGASDAWAFSVGSADVTIAFVDSGIDIDHPDLQPLLVPGYNAPSRKAQTAGGLVQDLNGHGTATASAATAIGNNGVGGAGVGWAFNIMPIRASNQPSGSAFISDILDGVTWALDNGADVVSVSYAGVEQSFLNNLGVFAKDFYDALVVWGIDDTGASYNFDHPGIIVVSGATQADTLASFSSYGPGVDFAAPATQLLLGHSNGDYSTVSGNSYATPIVAGAAAMVRAINPDLTAQQIEDILVDSADDIGTPGEDNEFGNGLVNAGAAATAAFESLGQDAEFLDPITGIDRLGDGIRAVYYSIDGATQQIPDFASLTAATDPSALLEIDLDTDLDGVFGDSGLSENVAATLFGFFDAPADRLYTFTIHADDGVRLRVGGNTVVEHDGLFDPAPAIGMIGLAQGLHPISIEFFSVGPRAALSVEVSSPTSAITTLDTQTLRFIPASADLNTDGDINLVDFSLFLSAWSTNDPLADFDANGVINLSDISIYLAAWAQGV